MILLHDRMPVIVEVAFDVLIVELGGAVRCLHIRREAAQLAAVFPISSASPMRPPSRNSPMRFSQRQPRPGARSAST